MARKKSGSRKATGKKAARKKPTRKHTARRKTSGAKATNPKASGKKASQKKPKKKSGKQATPAPTGGSPKRGRRKNMRARAVFVKRRHGRPSTLFAWQAAGLAWLGEVKGGAQVVEVLEVGTKQLVEPLHDEVPLGQQHAESFGRALARTHLAGAAGFGAAPPGWSGDGWFGTEPLPLPPADALPASWGEFYATYRLMPAARTALAQGHIDVRTMGIVERLCDTLADGLWDDRKDPARLHGDLWTNNLLSTPGGVVLLNPAAHGGNAETDLATLRLFGLPSLGNALTTIEEAWSEAYQPTDGWRERTRLHQLHTVLSHAVLFANPPHRTLYEGHPLHQAAEFAQAYVRRRMH